MDITLQGIIKAIQDMGGEFVKTDGFDFYFTVKKGSEFDNHDKQIRAKKFLMKTYGQGLKIKKID